MKIGKQSLKFNDVYLNYAATIVGSLEGEGPLKEYYDEIVYDNYLGCSSFEQAEMMLQTKCLKKLLAKAKLNDTDIDLLIGGDLINQTAISNYVGRNFDIPFLGIYGACSTIALGIITSAIAIESNNYDNIIAITSSHNCSAERQFRNPVEYGGAKGETTTFTVTGAASALLSRKRSKVMISGATLGKIIDVGFKNQTDMGRAMAPAAIETLLSHFSDFNLKPSDYDLILTGDLSIFGYEIVKDVLKEKYQIFNYNDCGLLIYDNNKQHVFAGGSGCACCGCVTLSYIFNELTMGNLNKVLICATGALLNPSMCLQHESIPAIAHAIVLKRCLD